MAITQITPGPIVDRLLSFKLTANGNEADTRINNNNGFKNWVRFFLERRQSLLTVEVKPFHIDKYLFI